MLGKGRVREMSIPKEIKKIIGGRTYSIDTVGMSDSQVLCFQDMVLKIENQGEESDNEHEIMAWLEKKLPVPKILCSKKENSRNYLLMSKINGDIACSENILENPRNLVRILAEGLRMLWSVDIDNCPYDNSIDNKLRLAEYRVMNNLCDVANVDDETYGVNGFNDPIDLLQWLKENKPKEEHVFSHGDYCLPNIFIEDNKIKGFIDLGRAGIADRYQDIAICYRSLQYNYSGFFGGKVYEDFDADILFEELGIIPDWNKIKYYILLDELF